VKDLIAINLAGMNPELLASSLDVAGSLYERLGGNDQVAKGTQLVSKLKGVLAETCQNPSPMMQA